MKRGIVDGGNRRKCDKKRRKHLESGQTHHPTLKENLVKYVINSSLLLFTLQFILNRKLKKVIWKLSIPEIG
jgi:hypothetical protein